MTGLTDIPINAFWRFFLLPIFPGRTSSLNSPNLGSYFEATRFDKSDKPKHRGKMSVLLSHHFIDSVSYNDMKKQTENFLLGVLLEQYPQLKNRIAFVESGSPLTNNFYLGTLNGEV
jgi:hypothetical protein